MCLAISSSWSEGTFRYDILQNVAKMCQIELKLWSCQTVTFVHFQMYLNVFSWFTIRVKAYLLTDRNLTLLMSFKTSSMLGIFAGFESKNVWPSVFFPLRCFIKSMAENVRWRLGGGGSGGGGGGGGGGGREPEGGGGGGGVPVVAAEVKQRKEKSFNCATSEIVLPPRGKCMLLQWLSILF